MAAALSPGGIGGAGMGVFGRGAGYRGSLYLFLRDV